MKFKKLVCVSLLFCSIFSFSQEKNDFSAYLGASYQTTSNAYKGFNIGLEYLILNTTAIAPSFSYYFSPSGITTYTFNADMRYYLTYGSKLKYYGIGGFSFLVEKIDTRSFKNSKTDIGFNAGGGLIIAFNKKIGLIAQLKYDSNYAGFLEPMIGINYTFN